MMRCDKIIFQIAVALIIVICLSFAADCNDDCCGNSHMNCTTPMCALCTHALISDKFAISITTSQHAFVMNNTLYITSSSPEAIFQPPQFG